MAEKSETTFGSLLHSKFDPGIYIEKMSNPFRRGTPDFYYEFRGPILWVEHKWIAIPWKTDRLPSQICGTKSWSSQRRWLDRAHQHKQQTLVVVGIGLGKKAKAYVLEWPYAFNIESNLAMELEDVAELIKSKVQ